MSQLFTLPPVLPKQQLTKREAGVPDLSTLRGKQVEVTTGILELLTQDDGGCIIVLEGVAGAGKTFITSRIIEQLLHIKWDTKIAFSATTNRAVTVSFQSTAFYSPMLEFSTIHKLLALKEVIMPDGTIDFYPDKFSVPAISEYKIVFIDECSQFSRKLWGYLLPYIDAGLKVVLIGDPFQTPPVKEADSLVFNAQMQKEHHMHVFKLTEIVRQAADNPIIGVTSFIRENIDKHIDLGHLFDYEDDLWQGDKGVYFMRYFNAHDRAYFDELLKHIFCSPNFVADTNFAKLVCWRNKTVRALNKGVRRMIYGTKQLRRIEPGEKIIAKAPVFDLAYQTVLVNNGTQMEVIDFEKQVEHINEGMYTLYYYDTKVRYYDMRGNEVVKRINIPTDKGIKVFNEVSEILASAAKTYKPGTFQAKSAWADFWKFQKTYANIQHDYAGTVHAIQGSSVTNTVVMSNDILGNPKIVERNKILYTGATRAVERLFVI